MTHPWIVEAKRRGIPLKSELQLGCEELKRRGWKLLAVTGSKGKSSVVKIVADAINLAGGHAVPCGNYGTPVCEVVNQEGERHAWAIVEVSSFQLETTELPADTFEAAVILNLQEDHLDRHGSVEVYHALKRKLLGFAKRHWDCSVCSDRKHTLARPSGSALPNVPSEAELLRCIFAAPFEMLANSYFDNDILRTNGAAAAWLMQVAGLSDADIRRAFAAFQPLPHRMNLIAEIGGVRYIDDSKATSLAALAAGVVMAAARSEVGGQRSEVRGQRLGNPRPSLRLIAGGLPKGDDPKSVLPTLTRWVKKVYLIGQSAECFSSAWRTAVDCEICGTLAKAVESAKREAETGETVLLSPGTASFDQFKSFGERGDVFADLVKKERQDK